MDDKSFLVEGGDAWKLDRGDEFRCIGEPLPPGVGILSPLVFNC